MKWKTEWDITAKPTTTNTGKANNTVKIVRYKCMKVYIGFIRFYGTFKMCKRPLLQTPTISPSEMQRKRPFQHWIETTTTTDNSTLTKIGNVIGLCWKSDWYGWRALFFVSIADEFNFRSVSISSTNTHKKSRQSGKSSWWAYNRSHTFQWNEILRNSSVYIYCECRQSHQRQIFQSKHPRHTHTWFWYSTMPYNSSVIIPFVCVSECVFCSSTWNFCCCCVLYHLHTAKWKRNSGKQRHTHTKNSSVCRAK